MEIHLKTEGMLINWNLIYLIWYLIFIRCPGFKTNLDQYKNDLLGGRKFGGLYLGTLFSAVEGIILPLGKFKLSLNFIILGKFRILSQIFIKNRLELVDSVICHHPNTTNIHWQVLVKKKTCNLRKISF